MSAKHNRKISSKQFNNHFFNYLRVSGLLESDNPGPWILLLHTVVAGIVALQYKSCVFPVVPVPTVRPVLVCPVEVPTVHVHQNFITKRDDSFHIKFT